MRVAIFLFAVQSLGFAAGINGTWVSDRRAPTPGRLTVQIEQVENRLIVLKLWSDRAGQRVERSSFPINSTEAQSAVVRSTREGTEISLPGNRETWTIGVKGELTIRPEGSGTQLILKPTTEWVEIRGGPET